MIYSAFEARLEANLAKHGLTTDTLATKPCFNQLNSRQQSQIHNALFHAQDPAWDDAHPGTRQSHMTNAVRKGWTPSHLLFSVADRAAREAEAALYPQAPRIYSAFRERLEANLAQQGLCIEALATKSCFNQLGSKMQSQIHNALLNAQDPAWDIAHP
jgi:hypothetical protein